jgi:hypothetical protein
MTIAQTLIPEFDEEMATTRRVLERVPSDKGAWKPHPKSFPLGHLAQLVSRMPGWLTNAIQKSELNLGGFGGYTLEDTRTLLQEFDRVVAEARSAIASATAGDFAQARRHGTPYVDAWHRRSPDDQSPRASSRTAHGVPAAARRAYPVDLRTHSGREVGKW